MASVGIGRKMESGRRARRRGVLAGGVGAAVLAACGPAGGTGSAGTGSDGSAAQAGGKRAETITVGLLGAPSSTLWGTGSGNGLSLSNALTDDFLTIPNDKGILIPRLAQQVPSLENGGAKMDGNRLTVTYKLRSGAKWQDGAPVTSKDVAYAFELQNNPDFPTIDRSLLAKVEEVRTPDDATAVFVFKAGQVDPNFAWVGNVAPKHLYSTVPVKDLPKSQFAEKPVHAGPYKLKEFTPNVQAVYEAFPGYWGGAPRTKTIVLKGVADSNAMFAQMRTGQLDVTAYGFTGMDILPDIEGAAKSGGLQVSVTPSTSTLIVALNLDKPQFKDVRVRQALLYALNRPGMMKAILHDRVKPLNSWLTPSIPYFADSPASYPYNIEKAKSLLAEAGWRPGAGGAMTKDGQPFKIAFWGRTEDKQREIFMQAAQRDWKAIGVDSEIILQPSTQVFGKQGSGVVSRRDFDAVIWQVSPFDANGGYIFWHGSQVPTPERQFREGENYFGWRNAKADALLDKALGTLNEAERKTAYTEHQKLWLEELPALPLFSHLLIHATKKGIKNYKPTNSVRYPTTWNAHEWELSE